MPTAPAFSQRGEQPEITQSGLAPEEPIALRAIPGQAEEEDLVVPRAMSERAAGEEDLAVLTAVSVQAREGFAVPPRIPALADRAAENIVALRAVLSWNSPQPQAKEYPLPAQAPESGSRTPTVHWSGPHPSLRSFAQRSFARPTRQQTPVAPAALQILA
jgi:hypothetical protein